MNLSCKRLWLASAIILQCSTIASVRAQANDPAAEASEAWRSLLKAAKSRPFYALDWHKLKVAVRDRKSADQLKKALLRSARSKADAKEQGMWVDAAAGRPEAVLAFYDANVVSRPDDKTLPNAACWARAARGLDLEHAMAACNAAVAADRKGYTLVHRGMAALQLGLFQSALDDFTEALADASFRSPPMVANAAFGRGVARLRLGDAGGREDIQAATEASGRVAADFADIGVTP